MDSNLHSRRRWALIALAVYAVFDVVGFFSGLAEYRLLGTDYTIAQANANDDRQAMIGALQFILLIVTAVFYLRWFKCAYANVERLGGQRRYGTGWAVGASFVPIPEPLAAEADCRRHLEGQQPGWRHRCLAGRARLVGSVAARERDRQHDAQVHLQRRHSRRAPGSCGCKHRGSGH